MRGLGMRQCPPLVDDGVPTPSAMVRRVGCQLFGLTRVSVGEGRGWARWLTLSSAAEE